MSDIGRRDLLRRGTAAGLAVGGIGYGSLRLDHGPVQNSQAIAPVVAAGAIGASVAVGWALREFEVVGSNPPAEGLTLDALHVEVYDTARARQSQNKSTIVDNRNLVDGLSHTAYADGKIAAINELNNQSSQDDVLSAATDAIDDYHTTILSNLLKSWNETVKEIINIVDRVDEHPDTDAFNQDWISVDKSTWNWDPDKVFFDTYTHGLPDGTDIDVEVSRIGNINDRSSDNYQGIVHDPLDMRGESGADYDDPDPDAFGIKTDSGVVDLLALDWGEIFDEIQTVFEDVQNGMATWVDGVYNDVQAGDLDTEELLTPREQAELTSDDEGFPQALADLEALNVSVDYEREAEVYLTEIGATLYGRLGYDGDTTLSTGTYDPDADLDGTVYLTYDVSEGSGEWDSFETGVDGGEVTFTSEPFEETEYQIQTAAGETATVVADDFSENDAGDAWTVDISDQVDDSITEIEAVNFYATTSETNYETIQLRDPFEIVTFTDSEGEEYEESSFEKSEPQDDSNYITEEEWKEQQERHNELIEKYEESQTAGISFGDSDSRIFAAAAAGAGVLFVLFGGGN